MIIGIDLGTTNSAVAIWRDGRPELIPNRHGHPLTPSVVSLDEDGRILVGLPARDRIATHPDRTAAAFKRYMGSRREIPLGKKSFLPEDLSALVLSALKADAEAFLGEPVREAVITVPAYFNDKQRKATRRAGEMAGLKVERLLNEPTAAALAYGLHNLADESRFLVFDLGGGTFDVSILEIFEGVIEVRASTGDNRLGGEDFNDAIVNIVRRRFSADWGDEARDGGPLHARLRVAAEAARRALTSQPEGANFSVVWRDQRHEMLITADAFEAEASGLITRLREPVLRALRDSRFSPEALTEVVMVGGATRMPLVRKAATRMFGRFPATGINPDEAVVLGAAIQAGLKARDAALKEVVLTDVCPYSLGVDVGARVGGGGLQTGLFHPIIERNTVVPASRVHTFSTLSDQQTKIVFNIYQGEARLVADNIHLGRMEASVPPARAGEIGVEVRFSYDINGLLEVDLHVPKTGERRELVISDEDVPAAELASRRAALAALKHHPRDADANRAVLARAARCFENNLGERRQYVAQLASQFEAILDRQDPREIEDARVKFSKALDALEGEVWF